MVNTVHLAHERFGDVVPHQLKVGITNEMLHIRLTPCEEIIEASTSLPCSKSRSQR